MYQKDGPSLVSLSHHSCMSKSLPTCTATVSYQHTILNVLSCPSRVVSKVNGVTANQATAGHSLLMLWRAA